ncbi:MAG: FAD-dependent oxidoreductase [Candidatus Saccharimonadales bacterium]
MKQKQILILGAGFAGVKAALRLSADRRFNVTLVSEDDSFRYYPALYHSATGGSRRVSDIPLGELLDGHQISFVRARAVKLDRANCQIITKGGGRLPYDSLLVALGMGTSYFGIQGLPDYSYGIKSIEEVKKFKDHLHQQMSENGPDHHYLVVGAGPTGVELAAVLPAYLRQVAACHGVKKRNFKVELIEAAPRVMPRLPKDVARATARHLRKLGVVIHTNQKVEAENSHNLIINGKPVPSQTVVWTAGLACSPFLNDNKFTLTEHHKAQVDSYLQAEANIYILGDNADTKYSGVAQTALYDAVFVANNLTRQADGKQPRVYKPKRPIYVTPTGKRWASVVWGPWRFYGILGWWLRRLADLVAYHDFEPWWPASQRWLALINDQEESCPLCGSHQAS